MNHTPEKKYNDNDVVQYVSDNKIKYGTKPTGVDDKTIIKLMSHVPQFKPFSSGATTGVLGVNHSGDFNLLSDEYDKWFTSLEIASSALMGLALVGGIGTSVVFTGGIALIPIVGTIASTGSFARCMMYFPGQALKDKELQYISMACLGMITNIMSDLQRMIIFYHVSNLTAPEPLITVITQNLYKYLMILLKNIDFDNMLNTIKQIADKQHISNEDRNTLKYMNAFFSNFDFEKNYIDNNNNNNNNALFRYSQESCNLNIIGHVHVRQEQLPSANSCNNYNDTIMRFVEKKIANAKYRLGLDNIVSKLKLNKEKNPSDINVESIINAFDKVKPKGQTIKKFAYDVLSKVKKQLSSSQQYRVMLREYVIMSGNFSMLVSRYNLDFNEEIMKNGTKLKKSIDDIEKNNNANKDALSAILNAQVFSTYAINAHANEDDEIKQYNNVRSGGYSVKMQGGRRSRRTTKRKSTKKHKSRRHRVR